MLNFMIFSEFSLINFFLNYKQKKRLDVDIGIGDDCAVVNVLGNKKIAITTDTLVSGVHFLEDILPEDLAYKVVAVNLSDLAAVGAVPSWISISLTLNNINKNWLERFSFVLFKQIKYYKMQLIGGDITKGHMSITCTMHGFISQGNPLTRSNAVDKDLIYVTGYLGDSFAGLKILKSEIFVKNKKDSDWLIKKHLKPKPRLKEGRMLRYFSSSGIDISDGLVGDLGHILNNSKLGAILKLEFLPLSNVLLRQIKKEKAILWGLYGGEDYELCFTLNKSNVYLLNFISCFFNTKFTCIGFVTNKFNGIRFFYKKNEIFLNSLSFDHFIKRKL